MRFVMMVGVAAALRAPSVRMSVAIRSEGNELVKVGDKSTAQYVSMLVEKLEADSMLGELLEASVERATSLARSRLQPELFEALGSWPTTKESFVEYLERYSRWGVSPTHPRWTRWNTAEFEQAADRLCQFVFLCSADIQDVSERLFRKHAEPGNGIDDADYDSTLLEDPWFGAWARGFADSIGTELDGPDRAGLVDYFKSHRPDFHVQDSLVDGRPNEPSGWLSFNQFAARRVPHVVAAADDPLAPVDAVVAGLHAVKTEGVIEPPVPAFGADLTDLADLIDGYGSIVRFAVEPSSSHRFYSPVSGTVVSRETKTRALRRSVAITEDGLFQPVEDDDAGLWFKTSVGVLEIETTNAADDTPQRVAVVALSPSPRDVTLLPAIGTQVRKGDDLGFLPYAGTRSEILVASPPRDTSPSASSAPHAKLARPSSKTATSLSAFPALTRLPSPARHSLFRPLRHRRLRHPRPCSPRIL